MKKETHVSPGRTAFKQDALKQRAESPRNSIIERFGTSFSRSLMPRQPLSSLQSQPEDRLPSDLRYLSAGRSITAANKLVSGIGQRVPKDVVAFQTTPKRSSWKDRAATERSLETTKARVALGAASISPPAWPFMPIRRITLGPFEGNSHAYSRGTCSAERHSQYWQPQKAKSETPTDGALGRL